jgi:hypothetical protein
LSGGLVAATRYWVYAYENAGALAFAVSTTAPDAGLRYMTGNEAYYYVSTFYTDNTPDVITYTQSDNEYTYTVLSTVGGGNYLGAGSALVETQVTFSPGPVPTGYASATVVGNGTTTVGVAETRYFQASVASGLLQIQRPDLGKPSVDSFRVSALAGSFGYIVDAATTTSYTWVKGFTL